MVREESSRLTMSARYDAMVEAWERANGRPCPLATRMGFQALAYGPKRPKWKPFKGRQEDELRRLADAQRRDQKE